MGRLEVEQGGGNEQKLRGLAQVPVCARSLKSLEVSDELERHLGESDLGDVQLVLGYQAEQQLERALEDVEVDLERLVNSPAQHASRRDRGVRGDDGAQAAPPREMSSRAICR